MANRDRAEICALILQACNEPMTRSKIMYKSLLNFHQVNAYAELLVKSELLGYDAQSRTFLITSKGRKYLELYSNGLQLVNSKSNNISQAEAITDFLVSSGKNRRE
jgi:predicted transcriptional regulator